MIVSRHICTRYRPTHTINRAIIRLRRRSWSWVLRIHSERIYCDPYSRRKEKTKNGDSDCSMTCCHIIIIYTDAPCPARCAEFSSCADVANRDDPSFGITAQGVLLRDDRPHGCDFQFGGDLALPEALKTVRLGIIWSYS